jgi:hypothetical protein
MWADLMRADSDAGRFPLQLEQASTIALPFAAPAASIAAVGGNGSCDDTAIVQEEGREDFPTVIAESPDDSR